MNLWLSEISGNQGINLAAVDEIAIALNPGQVQFALPANTIELLDVYVRTFAKNGPTVSIGNFIRPVLINGKPALTSAGDPIIMGNTSGTLSSIAGSQSVLLHWPAHGQIPGNPLFWNVPASIGGLLLQNMSIVNTVIDSDNLTILAGTTAPVTSTRMGATPLFATSPNSPLVGCILPAHGLSVGESFPVGVATTVGGLTILPGSYPVQFVSHSYEFYFNPTALPTIFLLSDRGQILTGTGGDPLVVGNGGATFADAQFENGGQLSIATQTTSASSGFAPTDISMFPLSRNDYAAIPQKFVPGRPTSFWFNRVYPPNLSIYPVAPPNFYYGFIAQRLRAIQDANPIDGQMLDMPPRALEAFTSGITAKLAEKYKPALHQAKIALAEIAWQKFATADVEHVQMSIVPQLANYFR